MGRYINPNSESFESALDSEIYVDKTMLLEYTNEVIGTEQRWLCVSRPRRFGKSITAGMLTAYYEKGRDSRSLFEGKKIAGSKTFEKHLNRYDVIYLDVHSFRREGEDASKLVTRLNAAVVEELRGKYPGVIPETENYLPAALDIVNDKTGAFFFIIIDEWDLIFREFKDDTKAQDRYTELLRGLFKDDASKRFVKLAYITGILPVKRYKSQSALNNFIEYTMISPKRLAEYVGFTQPEVKELCDKYHMDFEETRLWYDGYSLPKADHVYCPNSVVNAMLFGEHGGYWTGTAAFDDLKYYICLDFDGLKADIIRILAGERIPVDIRSFQNDMTSFKKKDDVLTILIHLGYLAYDNRKKETYIPNEEVRGAFEQAVEDAKWEPVIEAVKASDKLLKAALRQDAQAVAEGVEQAHRSHASILEYNDENTLRCVISLAFYSAINDYVKIDEMPGGDGFADVVFLPRQGSLKPVLIVELKYNKSAESAIEQIKKRHYTDRLKNYSGKMLLIGINYDKDDREKKHTCVIEEWEK